MVKINQIGSIISRLRSLLTKKHKAYLVALFFLTLLLSLIETIGVSIIMPFISVASTPAILEKGRFHAIYAFFGFASADTFIIAFGVAIVIFYIVRSAYNVVYTYILNRFALGTYRYLARILYGRFLAIPYKVYTAKNSSELLQGVGEANGVSNLLLYVLQICSDFIIIIMLYSFMIVVNWQMTAILTVMLVVLIMLILKIVVKRSRAQGLKASEGNRDISRIVNESYGNFKIIRLKSVEDYNNARFDAATKKISRAQVISSTLGSMPRSILESSGFSLLIISVLFILIRQGNAESVIPIIAMYALSLYRILPAVNKMLGNITQVAYLQRALDIVYNHSNQEIEIEGSEKIKFEKNLKLEHISFSYLTGKTVLHDIVLEIKKGEKVAITGNSGGGKSTLADIIIGVSKPSEGKISIDGVPLADDNIRSWREKIGYIPQNIYLFDDTVAANVVFGSEYDEDRLIEVLKMAKIWDLLLEKKGIHTIVGEGGIQLSGGQKQRIGIARALYTDPDVIVLDEATSALDNKTESDIMDEIYDVGKNKTLIIVAHRLSTIERCDRRVIIENGVIKEANVKNSH